MNNWTEKDDSLQKTFVFETFGDAIAWMVKASFKIEKLDHHPEWTNTFNTVHVLLRTHSAGKIITDKDRELAKVLDEL
jgi:4a-hydroxytetrahydrobiopterin dehydratase